MISAIFFSFFDSCGFVDGLERLVRLQQDLWTTWGAVKVQDLQAAGKRVAANLVRGESKRERGNSSSIQPWGLPNSAFKTFRTATGRRSSAFMVVLVVKRVPKNHY